MSFLNTLRVGDKLTLLFGAMLVLLCASVANTVFGVRALDAAGTDLADRRMPSVDALAQLGEQLLLHRQAELSLPAAADSAELARVSSELSATEATIAALLPQYRALLAATGEKLVHDRFATAYDRYVALTARARDAVAAGERQLAAQLVANENRAVFAQAMAHLRAGAEFNRQEAARSAQALAAAGERTLLRLALLSTALLALVAAVGVLLGRGVVRPMQALTTAMRKLAGGDALVAIPAQERADEVGAMARAVRLFQDNLIQAERRAAEAEDLRVRQVQKVDSVEDLADRFDRCLSRMVGVVSGAAAEMDAANRAMAGQARPVPRRTATGAGGDVGQVLAAALTLHRDAVDLKQAVDGCLATLPAA